MLLLNTTPLALQLNADTKEIKIDRDTYQDEPYMISRHPNHVYVHVIFNGLLIQRKRRF